MIELDLIVSQRLATHLALVIVSTNDAQHDRPRNVPANAAEFLRLRKGFVHEEHGAIVTKDRTCLVIIGMIYNFRVILWVERSNHPLDLASAFIVVHPLRENCPQPFLVLHHFRTRNRWGWKLLD